MQKITLEALLEAGCHFGHQVRRWNPAMKKYIYGTREGVHVFDLVKTKQGLDQAIEFLKSVEGPVLWVGTKRQAQNVVKKAALATNMPYVTTRWLGGMLTNFPQLQRRVQRLKDLKAKKETGELKKYTKREQLDFDREIARLEKFFGGVTDLDKLPVAMFVVDTKREEVAVREARRMGIPVVGMVDTNADPDLVDYVIPTNDDALRAVELIVDSVCQSL